MFRNIYICHSAGIIDPLWRIVNADSRRNCFINSGSKFFVLRLSVSNDNPLWFDSSPCGCILPSRRLHSIKKSLKPRQKQGTETFDEGCTKLELLYLGR
jgi:hypothetical protein